MRNRPLVLPLLALVIGVITVNFAIGVGTWLFGGIVIAFVLLSFLLRYPLPIIFIALGCLVVALQLGQSRLATPAPVTQLLRQSADQPLLLQGIVVQRPEAFNDGSRLLLRIDAGPAAKSWLLRVTVGKGVPSAITGDLVQLRGRVRQPRALELPGEFDRARFLARRGIHAITFVNSAADLKLLQAGVDYPLRRWFDQLALQLAREIDRSVFPPASGVLKAMLLGIRGDVPPDLEARYAITGVNHILSVSGFHVGVLAVALVTLCTWLARRSQTLLLWLNVRRWSVLAVLPIIFAYLLLTGMAPATTRSVLMLAAVCVAVLDEREHEYLDTLTLAALLLLLVDPWLLFDISCQLSFLALWGIIVFTPRIERLLPLPASVWWRRTFALVAASLAAILVTAPLVAFYFHLFSLTGIVANLFVVPLMGYGAVVIGFAGLLLAPALPAPAAWLFKLAGLLVTVANQGVEILASAPVRRGVSPSVIELLLALAMLLVLATVRGRWRWSLLLAFFTCGLTVRLLASSAAQGTLQATFLSVGQAEATLVRLPAGETMLVDTGGSALQEDAQWGERVLGPALWRLGVERLDYLVLTHPHADHVGGAPYLLRSFPVGEVWLSGGVPEPQWREIMQCAAMRRIPCRLIHGHTPAMTIGGVRLEPFWPLPNGARDDPNDCSLVFRLGWDNFSILFAGDIGWEVADYLARTNGKRLASTVLKVPHHGSRHSDTPTLYRAVQPELAMISAGYQNRFRLPSVATISSLHASGIPLLRTDLDGTVNLQVAKGGQLPIIQRHFRHFN